MAPYDAKGYENKVGAATGYIQAHLGRVNPQFGVTLGSGLGGLASLMDVSSEMAYSDIPYFPQTTADGHEGKMIIGHLNGVPMIGMKGRKHFYETEGDSGILEVVFPVHVLAELGVPNYFATNAAGGLNADYNVGDMMVLRSHINLIPNPLRGRHMNFQRLGGDSRIWRFQPMNGAYDPVLRALLRKSGEKYGDRIREGVYLAVPGPTYETDAESVAFRDGLKADAVGMSTAPEIIVARNRNMKAVGFSCITNKIAADGTNATNHEEVQAVLDSPEVKELFLNVVTDFFGLYRESLAVA